MEEETKTEQDKLEEKEEMTFLQHLEALRWHLIRSVVAVLVVSIAAFIGKSFVFDSIIFAPKNPDFLTFRLLCDLSYWLHLRLPELIAEDTICIGQNIPDLQNISMAGQFSSHILVSIITGIIVAFPYILFELWRFVKPALKTGERRYATGVVFFGSLLFAMGIVFGYYLIAPLSVNFLTTYSVSEQVISVPTLSSYITTITMITLASGIIFELPLMIYFLSKIGLVSPSFLKRYRKHALVGALILSAIITPPDVFSQLLVSVPLLFLYEVSIYISGFVKKKEEATAD